MKTVCVTIDEDVLADFDEWRRGKHLPRGAAIGSLLRLLRESTMAGGAQQTAPYKERVYEYDPTEPT